VSVSTGKEARVEAFDARGLQTNVDVTSSQLYYSYMNNRCDKEFDTEREEKIRVLKSIRRASDLVEQYIEEALAVTGLSLSKYVALDRLIKSDEPLLLSRLAQELLCVKSNITQLVDRLESDGLVERRGYPEDRRSVIAVITNKGRECYEAGDRELTKAVQELLEPFSSQERESIVSLLGRFESV
jgi:DNA-binding MarR family transcriptional regulator